MKTDQRNRIINVSVAVAICCVVAFIILWLRPPTRVLLLRHAESLDDSVNTVLSSAGVTHAGTLVDVVGNADVAAIYTTAFCPSIQTAEPLALALQLTINVVRTDSEPEIQTCVTNSGLRLNEIIVASPQAGRHEIINRIRSRHAGRTVVMVGHSNTIPEFIEDFGLPSPCPQLFSMDSTNDCVIPEDQYDNLFIVTLPRRAGSPTIINAKYPVSQ